MYVAQLILSDRVLYEAPFADRGDAINWVRKEFDVPSCEATDARVICEGEMVWDSNAVRSSYTLCPRCGYETVSDDAQLPELCSECEES